MSLQNLAALTKNMIADREAVITQGRKAFMAMFELRANPFPNDRERKLWDIGWKAEQQRWAGVSKRWREQERYET